MLNTKKQNFLKKIVFFIFLFNPLLVYADTNNSERTLTDMALHVLKNLNGLENITQYFLVAFGVYLIFTGLLKIVEKITRNQQQQVTWLSIITRFLIGGLLISGVLYFLATTGSMFFGKDQQSPDQYLRTQVFETEGKTSNANVVKDCLNGSNNNACKRY